YDPLPVNQAATLMCSGVTAYGALKRLVGRPRQRNLLLIGLGGVGMMGLSFAQAMFKQKISVADVSPAAREAALNNGAAIAYDPSEPDIARSILKETEGGFDEIVDFAGNEKSMAFAVAVVARGGKIVISGLMGGNFSLPMVQWIYKRMTIEGFMVGTLTEARELMALSCAATPAMAQKQYGPGATDTEIRIGTTTPYSGPASAYSAGAISTTAYFAMINEQGGVNGRKINYISLDDAYSPPKTVEQIRRLIESDEVLFLVNPVGTATNMAVEIGRASCRERV